MRRLASLLALSLASCGGPAAPVAPAVETPPAEKAAPAPPAPRSPQVGPNGEKAAIDGTRVKISPASGAEILVDPLELHPPSGERSLRGISPTALLYLDDGTLLVGAGDGTVSALDARGKRRASLGLRGAVRALVPAGEGLAAAVTNRGVIALVGADGGIRWERSLGAEPLSKPIVVPGKLILAASQRAVFALGLSGEPIFAHASPRLYRNTCDRWGQGCTEWTPDLRLDGDTVTAGDALTFSLGDPHPAPPSLEPAFPLSFRKILPGRTPSVIAGEGGETWALVRVAAKKPFPDEGLAPPFDPVRGDEFAEDRYELVRLQGEAVTRFKVPHQGAKKEVFLTGAPAEEGPYLLDSLARGPDGVVIVGRRISWNLTGGESGYAGIPRGAGLILELAGGKVRPRDDLFGLFAEHMAADGAAAAPAGKGLVCAGTEKPVCLELLSRGAKSRAAPHEVRAVARLGATEWILTREGTLHRVDGDAFAPLPAPEGRVLTALAGSGERDVWGEPDHHRFLAVHHDGSTWKEVPTPVESLGGLAARAADDVWSGNARAHWDGRRWSRVHGAPNGLSVLPSGPGDVWVGAEDGLYRGAAPGPEPVRIAPPPPGSAPLPAAVEAQLGAPVAGYAVERVSFALGKGEALSAGRSISAAPDGTLWILGAGGLSEVTQGKAEILFRRRGASAAWVEAKGKGLLVEGDALLRLDEGRAAPAEVQLDRHLLSALRGDPRGALWIIGSPSSSRAAEPLEHAPHALVRAGSALRPALGLPAADYADVAPAPDGGAFLAGARSPALTGEGILVHARGRLGAGGAVQHRASAALLAVSAASAEEAWAAGAAGVILRVKGAEATRLLLPSREWLRAVLALAPDDVWIGGDGGTLLHWDGKELRPVTHPLGNNAAFTGLAAARGAVWAVSPAGILRIRKS